jgi:Protein of unknown function (DUF3892)
MANYRIVCVNHAPAGHIESVGVNQYGGDEGYDEIWTVEDVRRLIGLGHRFYTVSPTTGAEADVEPYDDTIRTNPDESTDNNLDNLPSCE